MGVYLFSIIVFIIHYFIGREAIKSFDDYDKYRMLQDVNLGWRLLYLVYYQMP